MNKDRIAFAVLMSVAGMLATLSQAGGLDPKVAMWVTVAIAGVNGLLRLLWPMQSDGTPKLNEAAK